MTEQPIATIEELRAWAVEMAVEAGAEAVNVIYHAESIIDFVLGVTVVPDSAAQT